MNTVISLCTAALFAGGAWAAEIPSVAAFDPGGAGVILLGEVHDNPHHHQNQATIVAQVAPSAVVFEMLTPEQAEISNQMDRQDGQALADALDWDQTSWPDFGSYHPIFVSAGEAPIYGAAIPRDDLMAAIQNGAAAAFGADATRYGLGPLPTAQQSEREALQMQAHCNALPEEMLPGMVEAQRLRDAKFSQTTLRALKETGGPVVVITGNGHARRDWGMPVYLNAAAPEIQSVTLGQLEAPPEGAAPHDQWLLTAPAERDDPCAVFEKG